MFIAHDKINPKELYHIVEKLDMDKSIVTSELGKKETIMAYYVVEDKSKNAKKSIIWINGKEKQFREIILVEKNDFKQPISRWMKCRLGIWDNYFYLFILNLN